MKNTTQMYQFTTEKLGQFDLVKLFNEVNEIAIVPNHGGHLLSLKMVVDGQSVNILDGYASEAELLEQSFSKSSILLPFPNRLKDGQFEYQGKTYQFPINDLSTQNNLHGFKAFYDMKVKHIDTESPTPSVTLIGQYDGSAAEYPFPFEFQMTYTFTALNELECTISITNTGQTTLPIGFGWHPYFQFEGISVNDLELKMPPCEWVAIDDRMIPTGTTSTFSDYASFKKLGEQSFDNCFKSTTSEARTQIQIKVPQRNTQLTFWQETKHFPYFQIFTRDNRETIAVEPMTCNVDAFNNKNGLIELAVDEIFTGQFGIRVNELG